MFLDNFNIFLEHTKIIYKNPIIFMLIFLFLTIASYFDFKYKKIPNKLNLSFFIIRLVLIPILKFNINNIWGLLIGFFIIFIPAMIVNKPMGGDIKAMTVLGFYLGSYSIVVLLFLIVLIGLLYFVINNYIFKRKNEVPFAPFFLIAHLLLGLVVLIV